MRLPLVAVVGFLLQVNKAEGTFEYEPADFNISEALVKTGVDISVFPSPTQSGVAALVSESLNRHASSRTKGYYDMVVN